MLGDNFPIFGDKEYYTLEDIIKIDTHIHLKKAIKRFGLEGTEDVIKRNYKPKIKRYMLKILYKIWRKE